MGQAYLPMKELSVTTEHPRPSEAWTGHPEDVWLGQPPQRRHDTTGHKDVLCRHRFLALNCIWNFVQAGCTVNYDRKGGEWLGGFLRTGGWFLSWSEELPPLSVHLSRPCKNGKERGTPSFSNRECHSQCQCHLCIIQSYNETNDTQTGNSNPDQRKRKSSDPRCVP